MTMPIRRPLRAIRMTCPECPALVRLGSGGEISLHADERGQWCSASCHPGSPNFNTGVWDYSGGIR